jgi:type IX secretion system PorP/SprF family membrane protein
VRLYFLFVIFFLPLFLSGQTDPHFSQYYHYSPMINPAMTGIMNGSVRLAAIYRNQWNTINNPYETPGIQAEVSTNKNLNLGLAMLNQKAGDGGFNYMQTQLSINYTGISWGFTNQHHLSIGLQGGFIQRRFEPSKLKLGDQWVPGIGYNPNLSSNDIFPVTTSTVADISAGIFYFNDDVDKNILPFFGISAFHINRPADPFTTNQDLPYIPERFCVQGGATVMASENIEATPHILFMQQGSAINMITGLQFKIIVNDESNFLAGGYYRWNDAAIPFIGLQYQQLTIGASYDITSSSLSRYVNGTGTFELSLSYLFDKKEKKNNKYRFECPRF